MRGKANDWRLREWLAHFDKRQAALTNELGWNKQKANHVWHGRQEYRREMVNEVADWLGIEPYELLMKPAEAMAIRKLREMAAQIVAVDAPDEPAPPAEPAPERTGTRG